MKPFFARLKKFTPAAHRGGCPHFPENTLEAFCWAVEQYPECIIETDVHRTLDGKMVLVHDDRLERTTNGTGLIGTRSLAFIKSLEAGATASFDGGITFPFRGRGYRIPELGEALAALPGALFSIDIKDDDPVFAETVVDAILKAGAADRVILGSFHNRILRLVRKKYPDLATSFPPLAVQKFFVLSRTGLAGFYHKRYDALFIPEFSKTDRHEYLGEGEKQGLHLITPDTIRHAHAKGMPVFAWTVNGADNMRRLIRWGIDGIVTDELSLLLSVMKEEGLF